MSNGTHDIQLAKIETEQINHKEQLTSLRKEVGCVRVAVNTIDKKIAYFGGAIFVLIAILEFGVRIFA